MNEQNLNAILHNVKKKKKKTVWKRMQIARKPEKADVSRRTKWSNAEAEEM